MSKTVNFKMGETLFGRKTEITDTFDNVQMANKAVRTLLTAVDDYEKKQVKAKKALYLFDYQDIIAPIVLDESAKLLKLDKDETERLKQCSYSEVFNFFHEVADKFLSMQVPSNHDIAESLGLVANEDNDEKAPKSPEAK